MKALRRLTVRVSLPAELSRLSDLVNNLRWVWHAPTRALFESIDPKLWKDCGNDPLKLLGAVSSTRLAQLAGDERFKLRLDFALAELAQYVTDTGWYGKAATAAIAGGDRMPSQIAYFSPEFGITEVLAQYSGGLGILAGDHLKEASDLGVPIVGIGLYYGSGYFSQSLTPEGAQHENYPNVEPESLPLVRLRDSDGAPVLICIELPGGRSLHAQIWQAQVGRVPLLLLDSDVEVNAASERAITDRLYGGGKDHRIAQELLLGVGGVRAIRKYSQLTGAAAPEVYHTNEGHAGFQGLERIREYMTEHDLSFDEALEAVRASTVFTTHTPVPAGIDRFDRSLLSQFLGADRALPGLPMDRVLELGREADPEMFNMAHMGFALAQRANGVSLLHGDVSRGMFNVLWPGFDRAEVPIGSITNGVHAPTWVAPRMTELTEQLTSQIDDERLWALRRELRSELVGEIRRRVRKSSLQRGMQSAELSWTDSIFDPDVLTIGFARRVPSYKRLTLMLRDPDRLRALLLHPEHPIQIVLAGKAHPDDTEGKELIKQMVRFADDRAIGHRIVFLPDYDIEMARHLYSGCDVWLNNPLRPLEACGTSGMKAALNGGLNLSILDGWWDEMFDGRNGWAIPSADVADADRRDEVEANGLYELLEREVAPRFYRLGQGRVPTGWVEMVRHTLSDLGPKVLATRMLTQYVVDLYSPAARSARGAIADNFAGARQLAAWTLKLRAAWPHVRVAHVESSAADGVVAMGSTVGIRAHVALPGLSADDVRVQAVLGRTDDAGELHDPTFVDMQPEDLIGDHHLYTADLALDRHGALGYSVRIIPSHPRLEAVAELALVATA